MKLLSREFKVSNNSYDLYGKLKLEALLDMFETCATDHDKTTNKYLLDENSFWIVNQTKLQFFKHEKFDNLTVETYYNKPNRFDVIRNYRLKHNDELLASGASKWLIVSKKTGSFVSLAKFLNGEEEYLEEEIYPYKSFKKLKDNDDNLSLLDTFKVKKMDLDFNNHLNNTRYLYHISNAINLAKEDYIKELDMCYLKEIKEGTTVSVFGIRKDKEIFLEIKDGDFIHSKVKITLF